MDSAQKPRKPDRVKAFFRPIPKEPSVSPSTGTPTSETTSAADASDPTLVPQLDVSQSRKEEPDPPGSLDFQDNERCKKRYFDAVKLMEEAVKGGRPEWGSFDFPELKGEFENFNDSQFREKIASAMEAREDKVKNRGAWSKCGHAVQCAFTAFSPFAKTFLTIAQQGQSVCPVGLSFLMHLDRSFESVWTSMWRSLCVDHGIRLASLVLQ
jgi:hypothetical protein